MKKIIKYITTTINIFGLSLFIFLFTISYITLTQPVDLNKEYISEKLGCWEEQQYSKQWKYNCGISNITTIYNYFNPDQLMSVDDMREYYGKNNVGIDSLGIYKLLNDFEIDSKIILMPINETNITTLIQNNDFVLFPVNAQKLYDLETTSSRPNHSTMIRGSNPNTNEIYIADPNFNKTMIVDIEKLKEAGSYLNFIDLSVVVVVNKK